MDAKYEYEEFSDEKIDDYNDDDDGQEGNEDETMRSSVKRHQLATVVSTPPSTNDVFSLVQVTMMCDQVFTTIFSLLIIVMNSIFISSYYAMHQTFSSLPLGELFADESSPFDISWLTFFILRVKTAILEPPKPKLALATLVEPQSQQGPAYTMEICSKLLDSLLDILSIVKGLGCIAEQNRA
ncbi:hypothetical protein J6590_024572 [Homalodisca vitripennis]|nr:hypothetical protein J6590_024572 [Homalodisca vitripennis]